MDLSGQFRALMEQEAGLRAGFVSYAGFGRSLKPKRGRSWMVKTMDKFDRMRAFAEKEGIADIMGDWLKVVDMNRGVKEKHGPKSKQFLAVQKMTSGFIKKPEEFWQFKPAAEQYAEWVKNPDEYQASRGR
jgi:hypothetical protein